MSHTLPKTWARISLGELGAWVGGGTPSKARPAFWASGRIPWVSPKDMKVDVIRDAADHITHAGVAGSSASIVAAGSVLVVVRSGILRHSLPVAITAVEVALNQDLKALTPAFGVDAGYVAWALRRYEQEILRSCTKAGTTVQSVEMPQFSSFSIPLAPLAEQRRIVAAIEEHLSRLDAAVAGLKRVQAQLPRHRAAVLHAAVAGRLDSSKGARIEWDMLPLGELLDDIEAGKSFRCEERPPEDTEVGVVKVSAVTWGEFDEGESKTVLDSAHVNQRFFIKNGDLLFSRANTIRLVGACVIVGTVQRSLMLSDKILRLVPKKGVSPQWLLLCLRSLQGRASIEELSTGNQESMRNIGQNRIRQIPIPLPPLPSIQAIIAEVDRRLSLADAADKAVTNALVQAVRLRQSLLARAFAGQLVSQDPKDEPASALLEWIRSGRSSVESRRPLVSKRQRI